MRVVVVNYNGGATTQRALESLREVEWPQDQLEVVLVDNASRDGLVASVRTDLPWVRVITSPENVGFAGGCNLGFADLDGVDHVALLNPDAIADRNWLRPLVDALEADGSLGAACSKVLFAPSYVELTIECDATTEVAVTGLVVDGRDVWDHAQFRDGCDTTSSRGARGARRCSVHGSARVRVPIDPDAPVPAAVRVTLDVVGAGRVFVDAGGAAVTVGAGRGQELDVALHGPRVDVINSAGGCIVTGGYGADRGFLDVDAGQYERAEEVFAWSGAAVLLSTRYLAEVGVFGGDYFMYYEDADLSWRGQLAGWRYRYVPSSVVRHEHAASSREGSALFEHYVERNRLVTLARNAPWRMVVEATWRSVRHVVGAAGRDALAPAVHGRRGSMVRARRQARAVGAFARRLPDALRFRRSQRVRERDRVELFAHWVTN